MVTYDEFDTVYGSLLDEAATVDDAGLSAGLSRLRMLQAELVDPAEREQAAASIATFEEIAGQPREAVSPAMAQALDALARAGQEGGTGAERVARARAGMDQIAAIAATAGRRDEYRTRRDDPAQRRDPARCQPVRLAARHHAGGGSRTSEPGTW